MPGPADDPHRIIDIDALTALYGSVSRRSRDKVSPTLLKPHQDFIAKAGFCVLASAGDNYLDCSPRGDEPGEAFAVLDNSRIAMPDRRGNNRLDTLRHVVENPRVAALFLAHGTEQALRVRGHAHITLDPELLERFELDSERPRSVIVIHVGAVLLQNTRAIRRSQLWHASDPSPEG